MLTNRSAHSSVRGFYPTIPLLFSVLSCLLCLLKPMVASAQSYTVTNLGTLGGFPYTSAEGISYGQSVSTSALVTNHSLTLNLAADRTYHYRVTSITATGRTATSADQTFVTIPGPYFYMTYANLHQDASGHYLIDITFSTQGGASIPKIEVYGATLGGATPLSPTLPLPKFGLLTNASYTTTFTFPGTAGASGTSVTLEVGTARNVGCNRLSRRSPRRFRSVNVDAAGFTRLRPFSPCHL